MKAGLADLLNREPESAGEPFDLVKSSTEVSSVHPTNELNTTKRMRQERKREGRGIYFKITE